MLTPHLEKLILEGRASFKTFTAGGSEKSILAVQDGSYIVITDITFFPRLGAANMLDYYRNHAIQQLFIGSTNRQNTFCFRNNVQVIMDTQNELIDVAPGAATTLNVYLVHENSVTFSFTDTQKINFPAAVLTPILGTANLPPLDYGKTGDPGAVTNFQTGTHATSGTKINFAGQNLKGSTSFAFDGLKYPTTGVAGNDGFPSNIPLAQVNYVLVYEELPNLQAK